MQSEPKSAIMEYLRITAEAAGFGDPKSIPEIVGAIIGTVLGFLGIIFLILVIYGGYLWMLSRGNEEKVLKAKKTLTEATIGLIIILSAYSITFFVFNALQEATIR